jgi:hypothetical protein
MADAGSDDTTRAISPMGEPAITRLFAHLRMFIPMPPGAVPPPLLNEAQGQDTQASIPSTGLLWRSTLLPDLRPFIPMPPGATPPPEPKAAPHPVAKSEVHE